MKIVLIVLGLYLALHNAVNATVPATPPPLLVLVATIALAAAGGGVVLLVRALVRDGLRVGSLASGSGHGPR
jgi:hypothetical protein